MNRKNFFKNLTVGIAAGFWGEKLKALETIPVPKEKPTFIWNQMPEPPILPMSAYKVGDVFFHGTYEGKLIGKKYRVMSATHCHLFEIEDMHNYKPIRLDSFNPKECHLICSILQEGSYGKKPC